MVSYPHTRSCEKIILLERCGREAYTVTELLSRFIYRLQLCTCVEDQRFLDQVKAGIRKVEGNYEMPLPLKNNETRLPYNKSMAIHRLTALKRRLKIDEKYRNHYCELMQDMLEKGYAEKVPESVRQNSGKVWFIPHHGVYHPKKPEKILTVVRSLWVNLCNSKLLQDRDLTNALIVVLCRFSTEKVAFMCDIEEKF